MPSTTLISKFIVSFSTDTSTGLMFENKYPRKFFHQLVSSQLDVDRLDYLSRDSFYTGVREGFIGSERLLSMMDLNNEQLVIEEKGIYSTENFLMARRLMYWQVYLHKTVVSAEFMLIHALRRAKELSAAGEALFGSPALQLFLTHKITKKDFQENPKYLNAFADLDDYDIWGALKVWQFHADLVLSTLCKGLIHRDLFKIEISKSPFPSDRIQLEKELVRTHFKIQDENMLPYFVYHDLLTNKAYSNDKQNINLLMKNGSIIDLAKASDNLNISALAQPVEKYFLCYPLKKS